MALSMPYSRSVLFSYVRSGRWVHLEWGLRFRVVSLRLGGCSYYFLCYPCCEPSRTLWFSRLHPASSTFHLLDFYHTEAWWDCKPIYLRKGLPVGVRRPLLAQKMIINTILLSFLHLIVVRLDGLPSLTLSFKCLKSPPLQLRPSLPLLLLSPIFLVYGKILLETFEGVHMMSWCVNSRE